MQNISRYLELFCNGLILRFPFYITFRLANREAVAVGQGAISAAAQNVLLAEADSINPSPKKTATRRRDENPRNGAQRS